MSPLTARAFTATLVLLVVAQVHAKAPPPTPELYDGPPPNGDNYDANGRRLPGTLLLNMLTRDEAKNLDRTLPKWAKVIDYWIIGIDELNTDNSEEVIHKHLGHLPGAIVVVQFDGMGPSWTQLVEYGIEHFPGATHGIMADADFAPMSDRLDKMQLDTRCSKHMYTIWTEDHLNHRLMDWIYRNIPGANVRRRTHQTLEVPKLPDQEVFQTLVDLHVDEAAGYQDSTGTKSQRYIEWLEKDLLDYPDDPRTLYYLGYAHFDLFNALWRSSGDGSSGLKPSDWKQLEASIGYFKRRVAVDGNFEEGWFAQLKLGEIYERFYHNMDEARVFYKACAKMDEDRADGWFYYGQSYRLEQRYQEALDPLLHAARLSMPDRSLFQWHTLYSCLAKLELARAVRGLKPAHMNSEVLDEATRLLARADCSTEEKERTEAKTLLAWMRGKQKARNKRKNSSTARKPQQKTSGKLSVTPTVRRHTRIVQKIVVLLRRREERLRRNLTAEKADELWKALEPLRAAFRLKRDPSCREYRLAWRPLYRFWEENRPLLQRVVDREVFELWVPIMSEARQVCF